MRCLEIAVLVTVLNLLLSFTVVQWYSSVPSSESSRQSQDSRLLLSVEYQDTSQSHPGSTPGSSASPVEIKSSDTIKTGGDEIPKKYKILI